MTEDTLRFERANRLKLIIKSLNLKGNSFAKSIGVSQSMVSNMMNGNRAITVEMADKISFRYSHINPAWLLFNEGNMIKSNDESRFVAEHAPPYIAAAPRKISLEDLAAILLSLQEENKELRCRIEALERQAGNNEKNTPP